MNKIRVVLGVNIFLHYTTSWIYRQMNVSEVDYSVVCSKRQYPDLYPANDVTVLGEDPYWVRYIKHIFRFYFLNKSIRFTAKRYKLVAAKIKEQKAELIHVHFGTFAAYFFKLSQELKIPMVITFHGFDISVVLNRWPAYKKYFPELLNGARLIIAISEEMKARLIKAGAPEEKIRVSYLGVPLAQYPVKDRSQKTGPVVFLHVGRLTAKKGVVDLIHAFSAAFPVAGQAELWIYGDGEERAKVEEAVQQSIAKEYIRLHGAIVNSKVVDVFHEADVFVLNSRTDESGTTEGLPISILEASATALPVLSTIHAGIPESVIHNRTGLLVPEKDQPSLTKAMQILVEKNTRLTMGVNARAYMEEKFDLHKCNKVLLDIYKEAISE